MSEDKDFIKQVAQRAEESKKDTFNSWIDELEEKDQPDACSLDEEDCENCGS